MKCSPEELEQRKEKLKKIKQELLDFTISPLYSIRVQNKVFPVIGEGSHCADIMIIGEAPGKNESIQGRPFVGASGKFLDKLLHHINLKRENVYITNIVKDRPPENRDPTLEEIKLYGPFLDRQIDIIEPKVIATLGRFSMVYIMKKFSLEDQIEPISQAHGKAYTASASYGKVNIFPLYHPAVALYNGSMAEVLQKDFEILKNKIV